MQAIFTASQVAERVIVRTDGEIALEAAFGGGPGILLIAGTGSTAYARSERGEVGRCGGWGMTVGDEGSGYAIGRGALRAALRAADGRGEPTRLLPLLLNALQLEVPEAIPPWVGRAEKAQLAALVPLVLNAAADGDAVAETLLETAANQLARHPLALARRFAPWQTPPTIALFGGVATSDRFEHRLRRELARVLPECEVREAITPAVLGAVRIAVRQLASRTTP